MFSYKQGQLIIINSLISTFPYFLLKIKIFQTQKSYKYFDQYGFSYPTITESIECNNFYR